uniref:Uncharacterized protein n=1 Tax=Anguilla anguilla TaxID=7936 RepID=A0A0E9Q247_ANGAN
MLSNNENLHWSSTRECYCYKRRVLSLQVAVTVTIETEQPPLGKVALGSSLNRPTTGEWAWLQ